MNAPEPITLNLVVNPKQELFMYETAKYALYGGAKGGGKSWAIRTKQMIRRLKYAGSRGLTLRRTYPELKRTHLDKIVTEWKHLGTYNGTTKSFHFHNGSVQEFGSCQYEHNVADYQGAEYDDIGIDEATQFTEFMIETFKTNIRTTRTDLRTQIYLGANPGGVGHDYIKRNWVKPKEQLPDHAFIPAQVYDNHILMTADPEYAENLKKLPERLRKAFLEGNWDIFEGQALTEWSDAIHVCSKPPFPLEACKKILCYDRGYNAPGCALWLAFAPKNDKGVKHVYVYRELYQNMKTPEEWARQLALYISIEKVSYMVLPHDCFASVDGRPSYAKIFAEHFGDRCPIVRGKTLQSGARHMRLAMLHNELAIADDGKPHLTFHPNAKNTVRTLPALIVDDHDIEDIDTDGEDHAYDALTLGIMTETNSSARAGAIKSRPQQSLKLQPTVVVRSDNTIKSPDFLDKFRSELSRKR